MDKTARLTDTEAKQMAKSIQDIGNNIEMSNKAVDAATDILINGAKGEEIDQFKENGKKLLKAVGSLAICCFDIGYAIGTYINDMIANDKDAAQKVKDSLS